MKEEQKPFSWKLKTGGPELYEQYIVRMWMAEWAHILIHACDIGQGRRILDVACGTGIVARNAAALVGSGGRVVGLDTNEGMIRVARKCAIQEGRPKIEWYQNDVCHMPFSNGEFDIVVCQQGLQFFPDRKAALREMARVLVPGGRLAVSIWSNLDRFRFLADILDIVGRYCKAGSRDMFRVSCSSFTCHEDLWKLVHEAGFCNIHIRTEVKIARYPSLAEFLPAYLSLTPFAADIASMSEEELTCMFTRTMKALEVYQDNNSLAIPSENNIITADLC